MAWCLYKYIECAPPPPPRGGRRPYDIMLLRFTFRTFFLSFFFLLQVHVHLSILFFLTRDINVYNNIMQIVGLGGCSVLLQRGRTCASILHFIFGKSTAMITTTLFKRRRYLQRHSRLFPKSKVRRYQFLRCVLKKNISIDAYYIWLVVYLYLKSLLEILYKKKPEYLMS